MVDVSLPLPGLSPIEGKEIVARFDGGRLSSDGGLVVLREIERRLSVADRLAACIDDPRDPASTVHTLADIIRFRLLMIAAGYEDANDATGLRLDPLFKMALERLPSERDLCSQSTISRLENLPDARTLLRLGRALADLYCGSFRQVPRRITLDIDDTFDALHGASNCDCSTPITATTASSRSSSWTKTAASSPPSCARRSGRRASKSAPSSAAWCGRSAATGRRWRSSSAPTATTLARKSSTGARRTGSTTCSASRRPPHGSVTSALWRRVPWPVSRPIRAEARSAASSPASRAAATA